MTKLLVVGQLILSIILIIVILLQQRGTSLGGAFGGESMSYRSKRGIEGFLVKTTIVIGALFLVLSLGRLFI